MVGHQRDRHGREKYHHEGEAADDPPPVPQFFPRYGPGRFVQQGRQEDDENKLRVYVHRRDAGYKADDQPCQYEQHGIGHFYFIGQHDEQHNDDNEAEIERKMI